MDFDSPKVIGVRQTLKALSHNKAAHIIVAEDADDEIITKIKTLCAEKGVPVTMTPGKKKLGTQCGIDRSAAVVAFLK